MGIGKKLKSEKLVMSAGLSPGSPATIKPENITVLGLLSWSWEAYCFCCLFQLGRDAPLKDVLIHVGGFSAIPGTCSIHCAAIGLSLNLDRVPKAIYAGAAGQFDMMKK
ncbi:hypothetical protein BEN30_16045 [Magnetovibrio blakemorei]|uniref:Uncharacterized protein n=1 Tax=Magnetovibrio blakemorei TaxID=28181 RepID=A0A1E5Q4E1_9PROT|nr:hypothetical protein BEN30_16045 [Magnetovibrio blakemorei]